MDLVGDDLTNHRRLIVENQLEQTDHVHLGQLLTYAAGADAATIVWVSPSFREEHRQALDWLNAHTDEGVDLFGLQLEVIKIGDSEAAPNLRPVATPNEWASGVRRAATATEPSAIVLGRQRFFEAALTAIKSRARGLTNASHVGQWNWFPISAGRTGFSINWVFTGDRRLRVELYIDVKDAEANLGFFHALLEQRPALEGQLGTLEWDAMERRQACRVSVSRPLGELPPDEDGALLEWAVAMMIDFNRVFRPIVRVLKPVQPPETPEQDAGPDSDSAL